MLVKAVLAAIGLGVMIMAGQCVVMSYQDIIKFKDKKR